MNWNISGDGEGRGKVAIAAAGIVVGFAFLFFTIVSLAHVMHHKTATHSTTTTSSTTTAFGQSSVPTNATPDTSPAGSPQSEPGPLSPEGDVSTPAQLAAAYPQSRSNLPPDQFSQANSMGTKLVTTDTSGVGANQFPDYYARVPAQHWLDNLNIEWVYSNEPVQGVIETQVWYTGTQLSNGQQLSQVEQDIYLDKNNNLQPIPFNELAQHSINVDPTCCTFIRP